MNNFSIRLKLVSVAAAVLVLVVVVWLPSSIVFAQPLRIAIPELAAVVPDTVKQERRLSPGPIIGLICAIVASSVALGVAFGLRRRIDRIAGPDPEKVDND